MVRSTGLVVTPGVSIWRDVWNRVGRRPTLLGTGMENIRL